jgi:hypothetical protein
MNSMDRDTLFVALRVLGAINENRSPNRADVEELRRRAGHLADFATDELSREAIKQAIEERAKLRGKSAGGQEV